MNIQHLRYAVEVEKAHSINKAADNLFMAQPNLSRAIRELEESLGITIFERTPQGILVTEQGEEFLQYAKDILSRIDRVEAKYKLPDRQVFSVSVPRASYIAEAFQKFAEGIDHEKPTEIHYKETNSLRSINNILRGEFKLGVVRYAVQYEANYQTLFDEKRLEHETIAEYNSVISVSRHHPLAARDAIRYEELLDCTEIAYPDSFVPNLAYSEVKQEELPDTIKKRIFVYERSTLYELLNGIQGAFAWSSPISQDLLDRHALVQIPCRDFRRTYRDVLIRRQVYRMSALDRRFADELHKAKERYL